MNDGGPRILDVGCGTCKFKGSVGMDILPLEGVDVVCDIDQFPWPLEDGHFDRVIFKHSISHVRDIVAVMEEVSRICRNGARVDIIAPHYSCDNFYTDPTHKVSIGVRSMRYFCVQIPNWKYKYSKADFKLIESKISFGSTKVDFNMKEYNSRKNIHRVFGIEWAANKFSRLYEKFLCFMVPASEVYFQLEVIKGDGQSGK